MANNLIQIKRTSVPGRAANTTTLPNPGELALNMTDGIMYSTNGSVVFEIGANTTNSRVTGTLDANVITVDTLQFLGGTGTQGTITWNTDEETIDLIQNGATLQVGQEIHYHVKNQTGSLIPDGTAVMAVGTLGNSGRILIAPMVANGSVLSKYYIGVTTEDIGNGEDGKVTHFGKIRGVDLSTYSEGDLLWLDPANTGGLTTTKPAAPNLKIPTAIVISNTSTGTMFVRVQTGHRMDEMHDTEITSVANNQMVVYDSVDGRWENRTVNTSIIVEGTNLYYTTSRANSAIDARVTKSFVDNLNVDADTLDSLNSTQFLRSDAVDYIGDPTLLRYTTNNASLVDPRGVDAVTAAPFGALMWHDLLAFNRNYTTTYETYYTSNTTWVSASVDLDLFAQKENQSKTLATGSDIGAVRWQWFGTAYASPEWLVIGFTYTNPAANKNVIVETSADGSSWTQLHASNNITSNARINYFHLPSYSGNQYLRLTIERNDSNNLELSFISLLTARSGDQGRGKEQSLPFLWDAYKNITLEANTTANGNITATGDVTVLGENLSVGSGVTGEALIQLDTSNFGYPAIYFSDNGNDQYWTLVADDGDNNFKIQGSRTSQPSGTIDSPFFEIENETGTLRNNGNRILTEADEGSGNGLDADTVDGLDSTQFLRSDADDTATGDITFTANLTANTLIVNSINAAGSLGAAGQLLSVDANGDIVWTDVQETNVLYVSKDGSDTDNGSVNRTYLTIKEALSNATDGDTIKISSGVYTEDNPLTVPVGVSVIGDSLRNVTVIPANTSADVFWLNNGSYVTELTIKNYVSPAAAFAFPASGAGPITRSPYVLNCTSLTTDGIGLLVDGSKASGNRSIIAGLYTIINQGGIGVKITNRGYSQLVNIYTIATDIGVIAENGGFCTLNCSDSSFGNYGLIANGTSSSLYSGNTLGDDQFGNQIIITGLSQVPYINNVLRITGDDTYYTVIGVTPLVSNTSTVTVQERIATPVANNTSVDFFQRSYIAAAGHAFEYVGTGTNLANASPFAGGIVNSNNQAISVNGGVVNYTSTDQFGNFNINNNLSINGINATIEGDAFQRSLFGLMTPYILAIEGGT